VATDAASDATRRRRVLADWRSASRSAACSTARYNTFRMAPPASLKGASMNPNRKIIGLDRLKPGDVILCYGEGKVAQKIEKATESKFTHAAICYSATEAVEIGLGGIQKVPVSEVVARYPYVAVFRSPIAWSDQQILQMNRFLDKAVANKRRYNLKDALRFSFKEQGRARIDRTRESRCIFFRRLQARTVREGAIFLFRVGCQLFSRLWLHG
jgi:hypothetical protein